MDLFDFAAEHGLFDPPPLDLEVGVGGGEVEGGAVDDELHPGRVARLFDGGKVCGQPVSVSCGSDRTCLQRHSPLGPEPGMILPDHGQCAEGQQADVAGRVVRSGRHVRG